MSFIQRCRKFNLVFIIFLSSSNFCTLCCQKCVLFMFTFGTIKWMACKCGKKATSRSWSLHMFCNIYDLWPNSLYFTKECYFEKIIKIIVVKLLPVLKTHLTKVILNPFKYLYSVTQLCWYMKIKFFYYWKFSHAQEHSFICFLYC